MTTERDYDGLFESFPPALFNPKEVANPYVNDVALSQDFEGSQQCDYFVAYGRETGFRSSDTNIRYQVDVSEYTEHLMAMLDTGKYVIGMGAFDDASILPDQERFLPMHKFGDGLEVQKSIVLHCKRFVSFKGGGVTALALVLRKKVICVDYSPTTFFSGYPSCATFFFSVLDNGGNKKHINLQRYFKSVFRPENSFQDIDICSTDFGSIESDFRCLLNKEAVWEQLKIGDAYNELFMKKLCDFDQAKRLHAPWSKSHIVFVESQTDSLF